MLQKQQKLITNIQMGLVQGKVAWVFQYKDGRQESFSLHTPVARQFMQGLQELILALENQVSPIQGTQDGVWMGDSASVRLHDPTRDEEEL